MSVAMSVAMSTEHDLPASLAPLAYRNEVVPFNANDVLGFRLVRTAMELVRVAGDLNRPPVGFRRRMGRPLGAPQSWRIGATNESPLVFQNGIPHIPGQYLRFLVTWRKRSRHSGQRYEQADWGQANMLAGDGISR